ncbi:hypothetical protein [Desulfosediminicola sp.]|uniref:hypothetical protein n=1 Tax=Desulfosediminicola sp. TaxID=2886825 RepID=UPI003AF1FE0E
MQNILARVFDHLYSQWIKFNMIVSRFCILKANDTSVKIDILPRNDLISLGLWPVVVSPFLFSCFLFCKE